MAERSRLRMRELVTQLAARGLTEKEIGRAWIPMVARSLRLRHEPDTFALD